MLRLTIDAVASQLRAIALSADEGSLIGSEDFLLARLGASRATVRQAARLLEREGVLSVRRGPSGGYFASRPSIDTVEEIASTYLETLDVKGEHIAMIASVLWVEVVRSAASLNTEAARLMATTFIERVRAMPPDAPFREIVDLEQETREAMFALIDAGYIELIFHINNTLGRRRTTSPGRLADADQQRFCQNWRHAKIMELQAILDGDAELGALAARHSRNIWQNLAP